MNVQQLGLNGWDPICSLGGIEKMPFFFLALSLHQRACLPCACDLAIMVSPLNAASGGDTGLPVGELSAALT